MGKPSRPPVKAPRLGLKSGSGSSMFRPIFGLDQVALKDWSHRKTLNLELVLWNKSNKHFSDNLRLVTELLHVNYLGILWWPFHFQAILWPNMQGMSEVIHFSHRFLPLLRKECPFQTLLHCPCSLAILLRLSGLLYAVLFFPFQFSLTGRPPWKAGPAPNLVTALS